MVKTWEDVGSPKAYHNWTKDMKKGHYLSNFTPERQAAILTEMQKRVGYDYIQFSNSPKGNEVIDDINILA